MKQYTWTIALCFAIFLVGCNKKPKPNTDTSGMNNVANSNQIAGETISIEENGYKQSSNTSVNQQGKYNSSSDGFQSIYFGFGQYGMTPDMGEDMTINLNVIQKSNAKVKIEGNCDEFGTDEYNYALGLKRAKSVKDALVSQGVSSSAITMISLGESNPACVNPTDACYAQNRRVDLRLIK